MNIRNIFGFILAILLVTSCANKVDGVILDEELEPFFDVFKEEAAKRGIVFDNEVEMIEGYLQNIPDNGVVGACKRNADNETDPQTFFDIPYWKTSTELEREYVVFHELGHCFLLLGHDDSTDGSGNCVSIMASGTTNCRDNYNATTREALLDELFSK